MIIKKVKIINNFFKKNFRKKPSFAVLGLNPHNFSPSRNSEEKKFINNAVKMLKKSKIKILGPIPADTSFVIAKKYKFDVIVGMYHDQVLAPFKAIYNYDAINVTLGLPFIRVSPDHGVAIELIGKKVANETSLLKCINFIDKYK